MFYDLLRNTNKRFANLLIVFSLNVIKHIFYVNPRTTGHKVGCIGVCSIVVGERRDVGGHYKK